MIGGPLVGVIAMRLARRLHQMRSDWDDWTQSPKSCTFDRAQRRTRRAKGFARLAVRLRR